MDDNTFIYYLILGAIYLISRVLKKKKPAAKPKPRQHQASTPKEASQPQKPLRPTSFEDILRELTQELTPEEQRQPKVIEVEEPPKPIEEEKEPELTREQLYVKKKHEERDRAIKLALEREKAEMEEKHEPHEVLELLQEEGGAANAIVLSEILNRKY